MKINQLLLILIQLRLEFCQSATQIFMSPSQIITISDQITPFASVSNNPWIYLNLTDFDLNNPALNIFSYTNRIATKIAFIGCYSNATSFNYTINGQSSISQSLFTQIFFDPTQPPDNNDPLFDPFSPSRNNINLTVTGMSKQWTADFSGTAGLQIFMYFPTFILYGIANFTLAKTKVVLNNMSITQNRALSVSCLNLSIKNFNLGFFQDQFSFELISPFYFANSLGNSTTNAFSNPIKNSISLNFDGVLIPGINATVVDNLLFIPNILVGTTNSTKNLGLSFCGFLTPLNLPFNNNFTINLMFQNTSVASKAFNISTSLPTAFVTNSTSPVAFYTNQNNSLSVLLATETDLFLFNSTSCVLNFTADLYGLLGINVTFSDLATGFNTTFLNVKLDKNGISTLYFYGFSPNFKTGVNVTFDLPGILSTGFYLIRLQFFYSLLVTPYTSKFNVNFVVWKNLDKSFNFNPSGLIPNEYVYFQVQARINDHLILTNGQIDLQIVTSPQIALAPSVVVPSLTLNFPFSYTNITFFGQNSTILISNVSFLQIPSNGSYFDFNLSNLVNCFTQVDNLRAEMTLYQNGSQIWTSKTYYNLSPLTLNFNGTSFNWTSANNFLLTFQFSIPYSVAFNHYLMVTIPSAYVLSNLTQFVADSNLLTNSTNANCLTKFVDNTGSLNLIFENLFVNTAADLPNFMSFAGSINTDILPYVDSLFFNVLSANAVSTNKTYFDFTNKISQNNSVSYLIQDCPNNCLSCVISNFTCKKCWDSNWFLNLNDTMCLTYQEVDPRIINKTNTTVGASLPLAFAFQKIYIALTYSSIVLTIGGAVVFRNLHTLSNSAAPFAAAMFCGAQSLQFYVLIVHNFLQWRKAGFAYNAPFLAFFGINLCLTLVLKFKQKKEVGAVLRLMNIPANSLFFTLFYAVFGVGVSFWTLATSYPDDLNENLVKKDVFEKFKEFAGNFIMLNLFSIVCVDVCMAIVYFVYLPDALYPTILIFVNLTVLMAAHIMYFNDYLELARKKLLKIQNQEKENLSTGRNESGMIVSDGHDEILVDDEEDMCEASRVKRDILEGFRLLEENDYEDKKEQP